MKLEYVLFRNLRLVKDDFKTQLSHMAMYVRGGRIVWIGPEIEFGKSHVQDAEITEIQEINLNNDLVFPSFIEAHTHTVFAGSRADEFEMRNQGVSYLEIASRGGGILSTVTATRQADSKSLLQLTQNRVNQFLRQGVSTVEIKTGYALDLENELKCLEVIQKLTGPRVISTFLGAHAVPVEFKQQRKQQSKQQDEDAYIDFLLREVLPEIKKKSLSNRVDIFVEKNFFSRELAGRYLLAAKQLGFSTTVHANQLTCSGGADVAIEVGSASADHLIHLEPGHFKKFAESSTVAMLLPVADLYMKCAYPPARQLIDAGAVVGLATDFNPGSCPSQDISLVGLLARLEMKMSLPEVFKAYTSAAAQSLGLQNEEGRLLPGFLANFICTSADLQDFFYSAGSVPKHRLFIRGCEISS